MVIYLSISKSVSWTPCPSPDRGKLLILKHTSVGALQLQGHDLASHAEKFLIRNVSGILYYESDALHSSCSHFA